MSVATETSASAQKIAKSIAALPPLPATAKEILTCFGDEYIDADKVTVVVEDDPGICAKLLGLANSAYFGLAEPVNSIGEAISRVLGVDTVRSLVLAMAIQGSFDSRRCPAFDSTRFWMQALLTAECCKKLAAADASATNANRDLAYSTGLCHNLGLMALAHMESDRTTAILQAHRNQASADSLGELFLAEFETDHKIMTAVLARVWSLPESMIAAYEYRVFMGSHSDNRLCLIVAASAAAVGNTEVDEDRQTKLKPWADAFGLTGEELQKMAVLGERQKDRVRSLASNMTT